jgi:ankyrin repeat protein
LSNRLHTTVGNTEAVDEDEIFILSMLRGQGAKSSGVGTNFGRAELCGAAWRGRDLFVKLLPDKGVNTEAEAEDENGWRESLAMVSLNGYEASIKPLLEKGANARAKNKYDCTPLFTAASNGHKAVVKLLLGWEPDFEAEDEIGRTGKHYIWRH